MKARWHLLAIAVGSGVAFLSEYPPVREWVRDVLDELAIEVQTRRQYEAAIRSTLDSIRRLPETEAPE